MKNFYDLLEINSSATNDEIKKAFRQNIKKIHPDKHQEDGRLTEAELWAPLFKEAYETLNDPKLKRNYDALSEDEKASHFKKRLIHFKLISDPSASTSTNTSSPTYNSATSSTSSKENKSFTSNNKNISPTPSNSNTTSTEQTMEKLLAEAAAEREEKLRIFKQQRFEKKRLESENQRQSTSSTSGSGSVPSTTYNNNRYSVASNINSSSTTSSNSNARENPSNHRAVIVQSGTSNWFTYFWNSSPVWNLCYPRESENTPTDSNENAEIHPNSMEH